MTEKKKSKPPLGTGQRFHILEETFEEKGISKKGSEALAAYIGIKKYGKKRFQQLSNQGKRK